MKSQRRSKHPDWDVLWKKIQNREMHSLSDYIKSHDINQCRDEQGNTLLHCAVQYDNDCAVRNLSSLLIDPNIKNNDGQTALQLIHNQPSCLTALHKYHLCIDFDKASLEPNGLDALFVSIRHDNVTLGNISNVKNNGNEKNAGQWTALQCAAIYDRPHLIRTLFQRFPNLDHSNNQSYPVVRLAAMHGYSNCITALSECFPTISAIGALQAACKYNRPACIYALRLGFPNLQCDLSLLIDTVGCISRYCSSRLCECFPDIDPNKQDEHGNTALMQAICQEVSFDWVKWLYSYFPSTDANVRNSQGKTALMMAVENNDEKDICVLRQFFPDIDPNIQDEEGNTALMLAVWNKMSDFRPNNATVMMSQLHTSFPNIDPNVQNNDQDTALMRMFKSKHCSVESVRQFLHTFHNINANLRDNQGRTVLMAAIVRHHYHSQPYEYEDNNQIKYYSTSDEYNVEKCLVALCEHFPDTDPNLRDKYGDTALMLACRTNNPGSAISALLTLFPNIDTNIKDIDGNVDPTVLAPLLIDTVPNFNANIQNEFCRLSLHYSTKITKVRYILLPSSSLFHY